MLPSNSSRSYSTNARHNHIRPGSSSSRFLQYFSLEWMSSSSKFVTMADKTSERTFIMLKPDSVKRGLIGVIIQRFERRGYKLVAMKMMTASPELLENHYSSLSHLGFFQGLVAFMSSGPVVAMVWQGSDVVKQARSMLGETHPLKSLPGTIRGDYSIDIGRNIIHASDAVDTAEREIALWFVPEEIQSYSLPSDAWVYE